MDLKKLLYYYEIMGSITDGDNTTTPGNSNYAMTFANRSGVGPERVTGELLQACGDQQGGIVASTTDGVWLITSNGISKISSTPAKHIEGLAPKFAWTLLTATEVKFYKGSTLQASFPAPEGAFEVGGTSYYAGFYVAATSGFYHFNPTTSTLDLLPITETPLGVRGLPIQGLVNTGGVHLVTLLAQGAVYGYGEANQTFRMDLNGATPLDASFSSLYSYGLLVEGSETNTLSLVNGVVRSREPLADVKFIWSTMEGPIVITNAGDLFAASFDGLTPIASLGGPVFYGRRENPSALVTSTTHYIWNPTASNAQVLELPEEITSIAATYKGIALAKGVSGNFYRLLWGSWSPFEVGSLSGELVAASSNNNDWLIVTTTGYYIFNDSTKALTQLSIQGDFLAVSESWDRPYDLLVTTEGAFECINGDILNFLQVPLNGTPVKAFFQFSGLPALTIQTTTGVVCWQYRQLFTRISEPVDDLVAVDDTSFFYRKNGELFWWTEGYGSERFYGDLTKIQQRIYDINRKWYLAWDGTDLFWFIGTLFNGDYQTKAQSLSRIGNGYLLQEDLNEEA